MNKNQELLELAKYAFHKPVTGGDEAFFRLLDFAKPYTHYENGALTSMVIDIPFKVYWKERTLKMSGIGYVASYPEYRGNGAIRDLMTSILQDEYKAGTALSYLAPFSYDFYGKFGYAYAFDRKFYHIPAQDFPKGQKTSGQMMRCDLTELSKTNLHEQADNHGSLVREPHIWDYYFNYKSKPYFALYKENEKALGYVIYEFSGMTFIIREIVTMTDTAKQAIYRFIASHASSFEQITWLTTPNEQLEYDLSEPSHAEIQLQPYMMARIINLREFLKVNGEPDFAAEIIDDLLPENNLIVGKGEPEKMTIGEFTAKIMRNSSALLREYF